MTNNLTGTLRCYLELGNAALSEPAKIYVTGYNAIPAGQADNHIQFPKIFNPPAGDDDILIHVRMVVYDRTGGVLPGERTMYRELKSVKRIR